MDKKREQELREQYRIWKEEEIKWQERQEEESRRKEEEKKRKEEEEKREKREKLWEEYKKKNETRFVPCPYCKGKGYTIGNLSWSYPRDCFYCNGRGSLDTWENKDKRIIIGYLEFDSKN